MRDEHIQLERLLEVGRLRDASQLLQRALGETPDDPSLHVYAARLCLAQSDTSGARDHVRQALRIAPDDMAARGALYEVELRDEQHAEAEQVLIPMIREQPRNAFLLATYARLMLVTFQLEKSRALVDEALRIDPEEPNVKLVDVLLAIVEGDRPRAEAQLQELIATDPDGEAIARTLLAWLCEQRRYAEALRLAQELLRVRPNDTELITCIIELRAATHWLGLPLWPQRRFGWLASVGLWFGFVVVVSVARRIDDAALALGLALSYLAYVIYSWTYDPLMRRWLRKRGL